MKKLTEAELLKAVAESCIYLRSEAKTNPYTFNNVLDIFNIIRKNRKKAKKEAKNENPI